MCGRYIYDPIRIFYELADPSPGDVSEYFIQLGARALPPRLNISPTQDVPAIYFDEAIGSPRIVHYKWGLIPSWSKDAKIAAKLINARSETVTEKPSFRDAFRKRRCLLLATGFYEWSAPPAGSKYKQPWRIRQKGGPIFCMAGIWESWRRPAGDPKAGEIVKTCSILTTESNATIRPLHDRMPVILPFESYNSWLDPRESDTRKLVELLRPFPADDTEIEKMDAIPTLPGGSRA